jgi:hypothetical protein
LKVLAEERDKRNKAVEAGIAAAAQTASAQSGQFSGQFPAHFGASVRSIASMSTCVGGSSVGGSIGSSIGGSIGSSIGGSDGGSGHNTNATISPNSDDTVGTISPGDAEPANLAKNENLLEKAGRTRLFQDENVKSNRNQDSNSNAQDLAIQHVNINNAKNINNNSINSNSITNHPSKHPHFHISSALTSSLSHTLHTLTNSATQLSSHLHVPHPSGLQLTNFFSKRHSDNHKTYLNEIQKASAQSVHNLGLYLCSQQENSILCSPRTPLNESPMSDMQTMQQNIHKLQGHIEGHRQLHGDTKHGDNNIKHGDIHVQKAGEREFQKGNDGTIDTDQIHTIDASMKTAMPGSIGRTQPIPTAATSVGAIAMQANGNSNFNSSSGNFSSFNSFNSAAASTSTDVDMSDVGAGNASDMPTVIDPILSFCASAAPLFRNKDYSQVFSQGMIETEFYCLVFNNLGLPVSFDIESKLNYSENDYDFKFIILQCILRCISVYAGPYQSSHLILLRRCNSALLSIVMNLIPTSIVCV